MYIKVLIMLFKDHWRMKTILDNKGIAGPILMELPKMFGCIPHNLLVAKIRVYDLSTEAVIFVYS